MGRFEVTNAQFARFDPRHDSRVESKHAMQFGVRGFYVNGPQQPVVGSRGSTPRRSAIGSGPHRPPLHAADRGPMGIRLPGRNGDALLLRRPDSDFSRHANLADLMLREFVCDPYSKVRRPFANPGKYDDWIPKDDRFNDGGFVSEDVGRYQPNAWGLVDMHGNAAEWTLSAYRPYPYRDDDGRNDRSSAEDRTVRGGSWRDKPESARSACRLAYRRYQPVYNVGFRVVVSSQ